MRKMVLLLIVACGLWFGADIIVHAQTNPQIDLPPAIIEFSTATESLDLAEIESTGVPLEFTWQTLNVNPTQHLQIEQYVLNEWVVVADDNDSLAINGAYEIVARHPQNFTSPTYRLVILDEDNVMLTQRILVIPYAVDTELTPTIQDFMSPATAVYQGDLQNGTARVELSWSIANRLPNTNLVFEQISTGNAPLNIELPRYELWIPSAGQGVVAPKLPTNGEPVTIRLRVVDVIGVVHDEATLTLSIIPGSSTPPTDVPVPPAINLPQIHEFTSSLISGNRGDALDLTWHVTGAMDIEIQEQAIPGEPAQTRFADAPASGTFSFQIPMYTSHQVTWFLVATNINGQTSTASFSVDVPCPNPASFTTNCPYVDDNLTLAYQPFEHGFMLWRPPTQGVSGDTRLIYIFKNDGTYSEAHDNWLDGTFYELPGTPPEGLFPPERGFGYLFSTTPSLLNTLGWATTGEIGYQGRYTLVGFVHKSPDFMGYTNWIAEEFLILPDQRIIRLHDGVWNIE